MKYEQFVHEEYVDYVWLIHAAVVVVAVTHLSSPEEAAELYRMSTNFADEGNADPLEGKTFTGEGYREKTILADRSVITVTTHQEANESVAAGLYRQLLAYYHDAAMTA